MKKILIGLSIIFGIASVAVGGTEACEAYLNLKIDIDGVIYEHLCRPIFKLFDMKPGDKGEETISFHVNQTSCGFIKFDLKSDKENGCTEPEKLVDSTCGNFGEGEGELNDKTKWIIWKDEGNMAGWQCNLNPECAADPLEGDNILNGIESIWISDFLKTDKKYGIGELTAFKVPYFGFAWCFGEWGADMSCSGAGLNNETQGDSFKIDMIFSVEQKKCRYDNGCPIGEQTPPVCQPVPEICDNKDNDCDGQIDEDCYPWWWGYWNFNKRLSFNR